MVRLGMAFVSAAIIGSGTELAIRAFLNTVGDLDTVGLYNAGYMMTMTYGGIAARIAKDKGLKRMSAQAVGSAVGHNSISLIIPCHRVVGTNGSLTGYAGGIDKKVWLLQMEKALSDRLFVPKKGTAL